MAHMHGADLQGAAHDLLTSLERSAVSLDAVAHALENEFMQRFGHTGVRDGQALRWLLCSIVWHAIAAQGRTHALCAAGQPHGNKPSTAPVATVR